jgi:hypothetical protein
MFFSAGKTHCRKINMLNLSIARLASFLGQAFQLVIFYAKQSTSPNSRKGVPNKGRFFVAAFL